jgi:nicotinate-nucleotide adenylyltransferase
LSATATPRPRRIGLFGGSFDPPHLGHAALAATALQTLALDELRWLPAGLPWQKAGRELVAPEHRVEMLRLLMGDAPQYLLDLRELQRAGPSYTIDTVREIAAEQPGAALYLVLGQDQYQRLDTWHEWPELLQRVTLAVAARDGDALAAPALRDVPHALARLPLPRMDISSSGIREKAARGMPIAALAGDAVARYIDHHALYRAST